MEIPTALFERKSDRVFRYFKLKVSNKRETVGPWATMTIGATMLKLLA